MANTRKISQTLNFLFFSAWTLLVYWLLTWPFTPGTDNGLTFIDKAVHFFLFGIFAWLMFRFIHPIKSGRYIYRPMLVLLITLLFAAFLEYKQQFIPGRYPSWLNFFSGFAGAVFSLILWTRRNH